MSNLRRDPKNRVVRADPAHDMVRRHAEELMEVTGGDVRLAISAHVSALLSILSSIHLGNPQSIAANWRAISHQVVDGIESGDIETARGERH